MAILTQQLESKISLISHFAVPSSSWLLGRILTHCHHVPLLKDSPQSNFWSLENFNFVFLPRHKALQDDVSYCGKGKTQHCLIHGLHWPYLGTCSYRHIVSVRHSSDPTEQSLESAQVPPSCYRGLPLNRLKYPQSLPSAASQPCIFGLSSVMVITTNPLTSQKRLLGIPLSCPLPCHMSKTPVPASSANDPLHTQVELISSISLSPAEHRRHMEPSHWIVNTCFSQFEGLRSGAVCVLYLCPLCWT